MNAIECRILSGLAPQTMARKAEQLRRGAGQQKAIESLRTSTTRWRSLRVAGPALITDVLVIPVSITSWSSITQRAAYDGGTDNRLPDRTSQDL